MERWMVPRFKYDNPIDIQKTVPLNFIEELGRDGRQENFTPLFGWNIANALKTLSYQLINQS